VGDFEVAAAAMRVSPRIRLIMCTTFDRPGYVARALEAGCAEFMTKDIQPSALVDAIRRLGCGRERIHPATA